jgi:tRNA-2-methylthio-N6-dimethylallyladenosine synthase
MPNQVPKPVVQERYERLIAVQEQISAEEARALVGREVEVLVTAGEGRKDGSTGRISGRARDGRLVHVAGTAQPGDLVTAVVTDAGITSCRRWRGPREPAAHPRAPQLLTIGARTGSPG